MRRDSSRRAERVQGAGASVELSVLGIAHEFVVVQARPYPVVDGDPDKKTAIFFNSR